MRFQAFADALTAHAAALTTAPGKAAAKLLEELTAATAAKDAGLKVAKETIGSLGGQWAQACQLLWQAHCTALGACWENPAQAEAYFYYGLLPRRNPNRSAGSTAKPA